MKLERRLLKYILPNSLAMVGMSCYILADTFFISRAAGANGITALNLTMPIYSLIFAFGSMIGMGFATRYALARASRDDTSQVMFSQAIIWEILIGLVFVLLGILCPDKVLKIMGADAAILETGTPYLKIVLLCGPFFMLNHALTAFVRNDDGPKLAMIATLSSSGFNILFDYILMFPLGMGMRGAALATGLSPVVSMLVCMIHCFSDKNTLRSRPVFPSGRYLVRACSVGASYFIGEMASGITVTAFNYILLGLGGNIVVAAYGVIANIAVVANSIFNGIAQGQQPLLSELHGQEDMQGEDRVLRRSLQISVAVAVCILLLVSLLSRQLTAAFNSEASAILESYAVTGLRIYFIGFLAASVNIVRASYFSATDAAGRSFFIAIMRGMVAIVIFAFLLSRLWGVTGVWLSFPVAEAFTLLATLGKGKSRSRART